MTTITATFSNVHEQLGNDFYDVVKAADFPQHHVRFRNDDAATSVGLNALCDDEWIAHFGQFQRFQGAKNCQDSLLALRYHGHQFQSYNPDLGDGRGFLFAQLYNQFDGRLLDIGTKGSGTTPYSRGGDGRLTLKGALREALATGFLSALGVNTSQTLSIIETGEQLLRNDEPSPARSAVLARLSHSHIRFGTFQRLKFEQKYEALERLMHHCLYYYYPYAERTETSDQNALTLLDHVVEQKATTVAQWMAAGFVHGVLNTDNMNITGESFDYGPYRFLPTYEPGFTAAYFDTSALYAFGRQPSAVMWNLQQLALTLTPFAQDAKLLSVLQRYGEKLEVKIAETMFARFGLLPPVNDSDGTVDIEKSNTLLKRYFAALKNSEITYQAPFFDLYGGGKDRLTETLEGPRKQNYYQAGLNGILSEISELSPINPDNLIPFQDEVPNLLYEQIETIWSDINHHDDWRAFHEKLSSFKKLSSEHK